MHNYQQQYHSIFECPSKIHPTVCLPTLVQLELLVVVTEGKSKWLTKRSGSTNRLGGFL